MIKLKGRFLSIFLAIAIFMNITPLQLQTSAHGSNKIKQTRRTIARATKQMTESQSNQRKYKQAEKDLHEQIQKISVEIENIDKNMKTLGSQIQQKQKEVDNIQQEIDKNNKIIEEFNTKIKEINEKMNKTKDSMRKMCNRYYRLNKTGGGLIGRFMEAAQDTEDIGTWLRLQEYFKIQGANDKKRVDEHIGNANEMRKLEKEKSNKLEQNLKLKKVADDNINLMRKNQDAFNINKQDKWQRLNMFEQNLKYVKSKTQEMIKIENQLKQLIESSEKNIKEAEQNAKEQAQTEIRKRPQSADEARPKINVVNPKNGKPLRCPLSSAYRLSSPYGPRGGRFHHGIDMCAPRGAPVYAAAGGIVLFAGRTKYGHGYGGYGNCVHIKHANGLETLYAHLDSICVKTGDRVVAGQLIGRVGNTGDAGVYHLHFEVRINGRKVNPQNYF